MQFQLINEWLGWKERLVFSNENIQMENFSEKDIYILPHAGPGV